MLEFIIIGSLLVTHVQSSVSGDGADPALVYITPPKVTLGENITVYCFSIMDSLAVNYTLHKGKDTLLLPASVNERGDYAKFYILINSINDLGEYKCKSETKFGKETYSHSFNLTMRGPVSHPMIYSSSPEVTIGENVVLKCLSRNGSLPIKYTLYKGKEAYLPPVTKNKRREEAEFHFTVNSKNDLGDYKCKVRNKFGIDKYSLTFNFRLRGETSNVAVFVVPLLLSKLLLLMLVVTVLLPIHSCCKATLWFGPSGATENSSAPSSL